MSTASRSPSSNSPASSSISTRARARSRDRASSLARYSSSSPSSPTAPDDVAAWLAAVAVVKQVMPASTDAEADAVVGKAFGWRGQGYWRNSKVCEIPDPSAIAATMDFLSSVGVASDDAGKILAKQPEIFGCDVEQLERATKHIESNFFMKRNTPGFVRFVVRTPMALGCNVDCAGEGRACEGECNRCWART